MFTKLSVANFKSWRRLEQTSLRRVTGIFGSNSSGKTSLLQVLLLLKQTSASTDRNQPLELGDERTLVELGSFRDLIFGHGDAALELGVGWSLRAPLEVIDPVTGDDVLFTASDFWFETLVSAAASGAMAVDRFCYQADGTTVAMIRARKRHGRQSAEYELSALVNGRDYLRYGALPVELGHYQRP